MRRATAITAGLVVCGLCYACGLLFGRVWGEANCYQRRTEEERAVVAPVLVADPAYAKLVLEPRSNGGVFVYGTLSAADSDRLRVALTRAVGETRGREVMLAVRVQR